jgi:hypothetical protein
MGKQESFFKISGKVGDFVFYKLNGKQVYRKVGEHDIEKMRTADHYETTRQNQSEFAIAAKAGQLFRQGILQFTNGFTDYQYPIDIMKVMLRTLRSDNSQPKGSKLLSNGLQKMENVQAFQRMKIFTKQRYAVYQDNLIKPINDQNLWRLNLDVLFYKGIKDESLTVNLAHYCIDFESRLTSFIPIFSMSYHWNEKIRISDIDLSTSAKCDLSWTFVILQVWRDDSKSDQNDLVHISILDVVGR